MVAYERALQLSPGFAAAYNNLGEAYRIRGQWDQAVACFQRALQLQPDYAEACNNLVVAWQAQRKVNAGVLQVWAAVLRAVPDARLTLLAKEGTHRQMTLDTLQAAGVAAERVSFVGMRFRREYLKLYQQIDLGLDTFPYNGHTTSLDSFWMGVPVVSLVGSTVVGRAGLSQLTNLGLPELAATTPEQFVALATQLAGDRKRLAQLRGELRGRMEASPLMDGPRSARGVESVYRRIWQRWCTEQSPPPNG